MLHQVSSGRFVPIGNELHQVSACKVHGKKEQSVNRSTDVGASLLFFLAAALL